MESGFSTLHGRRANQSVGSRDSHGVVVSECTGFASKTRNDRDKTRTAEATKKFALDKKHATEKEQQHGNKCDKRVVEDGKSLRTHDRDIRGTAAQSSHSSLHGLWLLLMVFTTICIFSHSVSLATVSTEGGGPHYPFYQRDAMMMHGVLPEKNAYYPISEKENGQPLNQWEDRDQNKKHGNGKQMLKDLNKQSTLDVVGKLNDQTTARSSTDNSHQQHDESNVAHTMEVTEAASQSGQFVKAQQIRYQPGVTDIVDLSARHVENNDYNITAAVCYKTLFGLQLNLSLVLQWVAYYRLLGFDHIYMHYRPEVTDLPRWDELKKLPYVSLTLNMHGTRDNYYDQDRTDKQCLQTLAKLNYDWVMIADLDEYLRFPTKYQGVKHFLHTSTAKNRTYLSFAKRMYTLDHRIDREATNYRLLDGKADHDDATKVPFVLQQYPFYMDNYCYSPKRQGAGYCPTWQGRAKLIVNPAHFQDIQVHGLYFRMQKLPFAHHFTAGQHKTYFMEWPQLLSAHNVTQREKGESFQVRREEEVHIHNLNNAFKANHDGSFTVNYDHRLEKWFTMIAERARLPGEVE